ncbi:MAG: hypothetical protein E6Q36_02895 [Chryseobacterium sp.]|nr:MAG: hypothetical protein E6Q36_02895 [Chryseobacterium sp.]
MKSKVVFDLDEGNSPVIEVFIENTEDVRDKIACRFKEGFGHSSNIAVVATKPSTPGTSRFTMYPFPGIGQNPILAHELLYFISSQQLMEFRAMIDSELKQREKNSLMADLELK